VLYSITIGSPTTPKTSPAARAPHGLKSPSSYNLVAVRKALRVRSDQIRARRKRCRSVNTNPTRNP
jgi:hypothetical protein